MAETIKGITVVISGETTGLSKALADVNKQSKNIQSELKQVDKLLKLDPKNTELLAQKQKLLGDAIANTSEKLDRLKAAQAQVNEQFEKGDINEEQYRAFQREIVKTEQELKSYEQELKNVTKSHSAFQDSAAKASESLKNIGTKMTDIGKNMSEKVTAPIVAIGAASIAAFKDVDSAMDTIITKTGATGKAAEDLQESFKNISRTMPVDMQAVGDAIGEMNTQFGLTGTELEKATEQMLKFAQINASDVTTSTQNAKAAIEAYGLSAQDLSMVLDSVTKASQDTGLGVDQIYDAVIKGTPQIKAMGLDFATAAEVMGGFEQKGLDSSKALSYLSKAQVTWAKDGKTMEQGLAELQKQLANSKSETDKLALASELFGTKGASFMLDAIERGALDFGDFANAAQNASGTVSTTFEGTLDPIDKATIAFNNLKLVGADIATSLQEVLAPVLDKIVDALQRFSDWFNNLPPGMQEFIVTVGLIAAAIGPLLIVFGQIATSVAALGPVFTSAGSVVGALGPIFTALTSPIGIAIAAIAGAIAIGVALYKNWDEISAWLKDTWNKISQFAKEIWNGISDFFTNTWNGIKNTATEIWTNIKDFFSNTWNGIKDTANNVWTGIKDGIGSLTDTTKTILSTKWDNIKDFLTGNWDDIKITSNLTWEDIKSNISNVMGSLISNLSTSWENIKNTATNSWNNLKISASDIFKGVADAIISPFKNLHIPLPHFQFSTKQVSVAGLEFPVPDVDIDWYKEGAIFTKPSLIGVGEAGAEAVLPIDTLSSIIADTLKQMNMQPTAAPTIVVQNMIVRSDEDIYKISRELNNLIQSSNRAKGVR